MFHLFQAFLAKVRSNLQRISRATKNEVSVEELHSDAWITAEEIKQKRGRDIDFTDPKDQQLILGALNIRNVKRPEKNVRYAARADASPIDDEGNQTGWMDRLGADEEADPLVSLLLGEEAREKAAETAAKFAASYSQASAYVRVFNGFQGKPEGICAHLVISEGTLWRRVSQAGHMFRTQPSMFDRIERIPEDFMPPRGRPYAATIDDEREVGQWAWSF